MRKKLLILSLLILFILSLLSALNVNITMVSAGDYPAIYVEPETTEDPNLRPSMNYTISIKTDYTGNDPFTNYIISYEFTLSYDPSILNGVEVTNGDLIDGVGATFLAGPFDNEAGELSRTVAFYDPGGEVVSGPGTLAYVTFKVVGKGTSDITIGPTTQLIGWNWFAEPEYYPIIDAATMPTHIQHGTFDNRFPHDVAVVSLTAQAEAAVGSVVSLSVEVANEGASDEDVEVVVSYDSAPIETKQALLPVGESETVSFSWNITGLDPDVYTINATATIEDDGDLNDNWKTTTILVEHNVAVKYISAPDTATPGSVVSINVTVANIGAYAEVANVTIRYKTTLIGFNDTVYLPSGNSSTVLFSWNTTDLAVGNYTLNATATIEDDGDLNDNWKTTTIILVEHNVAVVSLTAPDKAAVGKLVSINCTLANIGSSDENVTLTVSYVYEHPLEPPPTVLDTRNFTLAPSNQTTLKFNWNTTDLAVGNYTLNATATIEDDGDLNDNWKTTTIILAVHDVAVKYISAPTTVYVGQLVTIEVSMENLGGYNETFEVRVTYDTSIIEEPKSVTLLPGVSKPIEFRWNTTGVALDSYTITAEAILDGDVNPGDNRKTKPVTVELPPGNIAGTVMDASTGDPIGGANVTANGYSDITDANGHYNITDVPAGTYDVTAFANGYQTSSSTNITVSAGEPTTVDFELTLLPGNIAGTVMDASTGDPIAGATVTADGNSATTDANGAYTINNVPPGDYTVTASATKYVEQSKSVTVTTGTPAHLDFGLTLLNGTISGIVTDSSTGNPISGATVTANGMSATTDSSGAYTISDVPAGTYDVTAFANGYQTSSSTNITVSAGEPTTVDFELKPAQPPNILLYAGAAAVAIVIIAGVAVYTLKVRKPT